MDKDIDKNL